MLLCYNLCPLSVPFSSTLCLLAKVFNCTYYQQGDASSLLSPIYLIVCPQRIWRQGIFLDAGAFLKPNSSSLFAHLRYRLRHTLGRVPIAITPGHLILTFLSFLSQQISLFVRPYILYNIHTS